MSIMSICFEKICGHRFVHIIFTESVRIYVVVCTVEVSVSLSNFLFYNRIDFFIFLKMFDLYDSVSLSPKQKNKKKEKERKGQP
jgi:hypothetical protein